MSKDKTLTLWSSLLAVTIVTSAPLLYADEPATTPDGYRIVPVTVDGHTIPVKVRDQNPFKNVASQNNSGPYDPRSINFSAESPMANKKFDAPGVAPSQSASSTQNQTYLTKAYIDDAAHAVPNVHNKADFASNSDYHKNASDIDKSYTTAKADIGPDGASLLAKADSADQNRSALLNSKAVETTESPDANKTFQGPEADAVHQHLTKTDDGRIAISDLPDRALTIDEVRNLINHGVKPNTEVKPEETSKPLNDPNYKPEPLRISPAADDDKSDAVPPPGTMATPPPPENSEPLPQN